MEVAVVGVHVVRLALFFVICSVGGWCFDTLLRSIRRKRWAPIRAVPFSPLYGSAAFAVLFAPKFAPLASELALRAAAHFFYFALVFCAFELVAGMLILRVRGERIWDYRDRHFNLDGHTDLFHFFLWGTTGVVGLYLLLPPLRTFLGLGG